MKTTRLLVTALLALAFTAGPLLASEAIRETPIAQGGGQKAGAVRLATIRTAAVGLLIEIPASRLIFRHHLSVPEGSTVSQAVESVYSVKHGVVCCDSRDIWAVNGLAVDPAKEKWWIIKVNGNTQNASSQSRLKDGDIVELVYLEKAFYPVAHVRLEEWVTNASNYVKKR